MGRACNRTFLPLCSIPSPRTREGYAGATAKLRLPFDDEGLWFASGARMSGEGATIAQDRRNYIGGTTMPDTFQKDCCS